LSFERAHEGLIVGAARGGETFLQVVMFAD
jgi:hypothetical protein